MLECLILAILPDKSEGGQLFTDQFVMIHLIFFHFLLCRGRLLFHLQRAGYDSLEKWVFAALFAVFGILLLFLFLGLGRESPFLGLKHSSAVRLVLSVRLLAENMLRKGDLIQQDGFQA